MVGGGRGGDGLEGVLGSGGLLGDELAADLDLLGQVGDGERPGERLHGEVLAVLPGERLGRARDGTVGVREYPTSVSSIETGEGCIFTSLEETDDLHSPNLLRVCYPSLNQPKIPMLSFDPSLPNIR